MPRSSSPLRSAALAGALGPFAAAALLTGAAPAFATEVSFKFEPGVTLPLTAPQSQVYGVGGGQSVKALFGITSFLDIGPTASLTLLPSSAPQGATGVAWGLGGGIRLKRPHDATSFYGISPWMDADALYIRTGALNRPGFDVAIGASIPVGEARTFWVGPFVRYLHVMQLDRPGYDNRDAKLLTIGISFEAGTGVKRAAKPVEEEVRTVTQDVYSCPDRDADTVPDNVDRCPEVSGPMDNWGCPNYEKVVVKRDKLELKERLFFAWDAATLEPESYPVLDEVVQALKDNKNFRVQVEGHTDSSGGDSHNQTLSEQRANAVLDYLVAQGVSKDRLVSKGFSSSVPTQTNTTVEGREANRRVEFVVSFIILPESAK